MKVEGTCHCQAVRFEAEIDPATVSICNCTDCQVLSGSAYRVSAPAPAETFRLLGGKPKAYVKTAESGNKRRHFFCGDCGTAVFATAPVDAPTSYMLRVSTLKQRTQLTPRRQIWTRSALPWSRDLSGIPGIERQP